MRPTATASCHLWLPLDTSGYLPLATCLSIGKFSFRHAATIRRPSQRFRRAAEIVIVNKYLFSRLCSIPASSCAIPLLLEIPLNTNTSSQLLPSVLRTHVVDFSFLRAPLSPFSSFPLHILMTIFCYSFRLVQFQFSTTDCYLNDSIPFCFFGLGPCPTPSSRHERIFYCILNIFSIIFEQLLCCCCQRCEIVLCYSSLICPFSTWPIRRSASNWRLKCFSFECFRPRMCATVHSKCFPYEPQRFHIISSIMCCLFCGFQMIWLSVRVAENALTQVSKDYRNR